MDSQQNHIGQIWSDRYDQKRKTPARTGWSHSARVINAITQRICDIPCSSIREAIARLIKKISPDLPYSNGISVGCGVGDKEMDLIEQGIVSHFDCYEFSVKAVEEGNKEAVARGLKNAISFHNKDAFKEDFSSGCYDFVYWDNAMHHMNDTYEAMRWSKKLLAKRGCFFMYDYVGPSRFQWTEEQMDIVKHILESLDDRYFLIPGSEYMWKKEPSRMTIEEMLRADPSEAADSDNILAAFAEHFEKGTTIPLGGLIYVLALDGILVNIPEESTLLGHMLKLDAMLSKKGHNYYAVSYYINA